MLSESAHLQPQHWLKQPQHACALRVSASAAAASGAIDGLQVYILEQAQHENRVDTELVQTRKRAAKGPGPGPGVPVLDFMFAFSEAGCRDSLQGTLYPQSMT